MSRSRLNTAEIDRKLREVGKPDITDKSLQTLHDISGMLTDRQNAQRMKTMLNDYPK